MTLKAKQSKAAKTFATTDVFFIAHPPNETPFNGRGGRKATLIELIAALERGPEPTRLNQVSREFVPDDVRAEWLAVYTKEWERRLRARIAGQSRGKLTTLAPEMVEVLKTVFRMTDGAGDSEGELQLIAEVVRPILKKLEKIK